MSCTLRITNMNCVVFIWNIIWIFIPLVTGGLCPDFGIPVARPCMHSSVSGSRIMIDTSEIPISELSCTCELSTNSNNVGVSLYKYPGYENCGTEIQFSQISPVTFRCISAGTVIDTTTHKSVPIITRKNRELSDVRYCLLIQVSSGNVSVTCRSPGVTATSSVSETTSLPSTQSSSRQTTITTPTTQQIIQISTSQTQRVTPQTIQSTSQTFSQTGSEAFTESSTIPPEAMSTPSTIPPEAMSTPSAIPPEAMSTPSKMVSVISNAISTTSGTILSEAFTESSTIPPNSQSHTTTTLRSTNPIQEESSQTQTQVSSSPKTSEPLGKSTSSVATHGQTPSSKTQTPVSTSPTSSELLEKSTSPSALTEQTSSVTSPSIPDTKTILLETSQFTPESSETIPTLASTSLGEQTNPTSNIINTTVTSESKSNVTLPGDNNSDRMTAVIVICTLIGIGLIIVLVVAIFYQRKQQRKEAFSLQRSTFSNMALELDEEKEASKKINGLNNSCDETPNLIPYSTEKT